MLQYDPNDATRYFGHSLVMYRDEPWFVERVNETSHLLGRPLAEYIYIVEARPKTHPRLQRIVNEEADPWWPEPASVNYGYAAHLMVEPLRSTLRSVTPQHMVAMNPNPMRAPFPSTISRYKAFLAMFDPTYPTDMRAAQETAGFQFGYVALSRTVILGPEEVVFFQGVRAGTIQDLYGPVKRVHSLMAKSIERRGFIL
jgi:hypothetical protein